MILSAQTRRRRRGATTVELAFVIAIFSLLLFGILEYCLILYTEHVVYNAAREGSRFAVVNTTGSTVITDTQNRVKAYLAGMDAKAKNYKCDVYLADSTGKSIGAASDAQFGQYVCVDVSLDYVPITPGLLHLKTFTIRAKSSMGSEAN